MAAQLCLGRAMPVLWVFGLCFLLPVVSASYFPAMFVFGDSLMDPGNYEKLVTLAHATRPPYGRDFGSHEPNGRFCDGLLSSDFVASLAGLPYPPAYLLNPNDILQGSSFASSGGGILNLTGYQVLQRVNFVQQVGYFSDVKSALIQKIGAQQTTTMLSKSLFLLCIGSNDYLANYYGNPFSSSRTERKYSTEQFKNLLIFNYEQNLLKLYNLGARKFALVSLSALGCIPLELLLARSVNGTCVADINAAVRSFNAALLQLSQQLQATHPDARFTYLDSYDIMIKMRSDPPAYGFLYGSSACCGSGPYRGTPCAQKLSKVCPDASQYIFWDFAHPTQAANKVIASQLWAGTAPDVNPINVMQLATA